MTLERTGKKSFKKARWLLLGIKTKQEINKTMGVGGKERSQSQPTKEKGRGVWR